MDPFVEHHYFQRALKSLTRINNGDIQPEQFVHEISHAAAYLSHFGQKEIFHRILECDNTLIYYALRKLEFRNLHNIVNFLTKGFLYSKSFGHFASKLDDSSRDQDEHFYEFYLRLRNILRRAEDQLEKSQPQLSSLFRDQLDVLARMVFVRELPTYLYQNVYKSAPETLDDAAELANYFYSTGIRPLCVEYSNPPTEILEETKNYYTDSRFEYTVPKQYDYHYDSRSPAEESACSSSNSEYEHDSPTVYPQNISSYYTESAGNDHDTNYSNTNCASIKRRNADYIQLKQPQNFYLDQSLENSNANSDNYSTYDDRFSAEDSTSNISNSEDNEKKMDSNKIDTHKNAKYKLSIPILSYTGSEQSFNSKLYPIAVQIGQHIFPIINSHNINNSISSNESSDHYSLSENLNTTNSNSDRDYDSPVVSSSNFSNYYYESTEVDSESLCNNRNSDSEVSSQISEGSEFSEGLPIESEFSSESDRTISEISKYSKPECQTSYPVVRNYRISIVPIVPTKTRNYDSITVDFRDISNCKITPKTGDTLPVRPYILNQNISNNLSKEFNQKPHFFRFTPILKKGYKVSPKIKKFLSVYRHNRHSSNKSTRPDLAIEGVNGENTELNKPTVSEYILSQNKLTKSCPYQSDELSTYDNVSALLKPLQKLKIISNAKSEFIDHFRNKESSVFSQNSDSKLDYCIPIAQESLKTLKLICNKETFSVFDWETASDLRIADSSNLDKFVESHKIFVFLDATFRPVVWYQLYSSNHLKPFKSNLTLKLSNFKVHTLWHILILKILIEIYFVWILLVNYRLYKLMSVFNRKTAADLRIAIK